MRYVDPVDGFTYTRTDTVQQQSTAAVVLLFDSVWTRQANRYPTSDLIVVNGEANLPNNWDNPGFFDPAAGVSPGKVEYFPQRDSLTLSFGYNTTLSSLGCAAPVAKELWVGVRCAWGQANLACRYDISARLLPRVVHGGSVVTAPISAGTIHYYGLNVGAFDVARVLLDRQDADLTYTDEEGDVRTHDFALRGQLIAQRSYCPDPTANPPPPPPPPSPPPPELDTDGDPAAATSTSSAASSSADANADGSSFRILEAPITNASASSSLELFCTTVSESGPYAIAVIASSVQGPLLLAHDSKSGAADCTNGYVGPNDVPIYKSISTPGSLPQCNPNGPLNELKPSRPFYTLRVEHSAFADVPFARKEIRPMCIGFGQWRRFTVRSNSDLAANLYVALTARVSRVLIREDAPPTLEEYDVGTAADEAGGGGFPAGGEAANGAAGTGATVDASGAVSAVAGASSVASSAGGSGNTTLISATTVSASPCDPSVARTWHIAIYLAPESEAAARGLTPLTFSVNASLGPARIVLPRAPAGGGAPSALIHPRSMGGEGSTCCGQMTTYVVFVNSSLVALRVRVNVTLGALRAVYVKHGTCAAFPADILGKQCVGRTPFCHMTWYERYDRYTGAKRYSSSNMTLVPSGGDSPDKRQTGDWYISVQDAGTAQRTEFSLLIDEVVSAASDRSEGCDRFGRYDCSNDMWKVPPDLPSALTAGSGAAGRAEPATTTAAALLVLASAWLLLPGLKRAGGRRRDERMYMCIDEPIPER